MRSIAAAALVVASASVASAEDRQCRVLDLELLPLASDGNRFAPQIAAWLEDAQGNFIETVYLTQSVGTFGIGNRPGRFDFNSGPLWPYGRRITTFPVWSTKQPLRWPSIEFQDGNDDGLSHKIKQSSRELHFCRPTRNNAEFDAVSCPSERVDTDKGVLTDVDSSRYPPREDAAFTTNDHPSSEMMAMLNPFDTISQPTPVLDVAAHLSHPITAELPTGDYVLFVEVSKEFDHNETYNQLTYPSPIVIFNDYGRAYRGQPSIIYRVPLAIGPSNTFGTTTEYAGYGDPDGLDGAIRAPDATISNLPGSGAGRLGMMSSGGQTFRVRATARHELDDIEPDHPRRMEAEAITSTGATLTFIAPGDDYQQGTVRGYEVRYRVGEPITEDNFATSSVVTTSAEIVTARTEQSVTIEGLLPDTTYFVGIRAYDDCHNTSTLSTIEVTTEPRTSGSVDACFVATAAYGSPMANDVEQLRSFRDRLLGKTALGELAIESYYTFGPVLARFVGESELLRATAREALAPIIERVR
jgi:hypothetical protein